MKVIIAGGSGFLGRRLSSALAAEGHHVAVLTRGPGGLSPTPRVRLVQWAPTGSSGPWAGEVDGADAVVNLAGESIAGGRWTDERKRKITESRLRATKSLVEAINSSAARPPIFVSGSAVGYYGPSDDQPLTEDAPSGTDFLARLCVKWEAEAQRAATPRTRVVCIRTGLVLERDGGALPRMLLPFKMGVGGRLGSGRQFWPWIHLDDWVAMVRWAFVTPGLSGAVNVTAPNPVTNADFAHYLGGAMHRPSIVPTPAFALRLILGREMADSVLLSGQRAIPAKAQGLWFTFTYPHLDDALRSIFGRSSAAAR